MSQPGMERSGVHERGHHTPDPSPSVLPRRLCLGSEDEFEVFDGERWVFEDVSTLPPPLPTLWGQCPGCGTPTVNDATYCTAACAGLNELDRLAEDDARDEDF